MKILRLIAFTTIMASLFFIAPVNASSDSKRAELNLVTALISMASYDDEINLLTREWLKDMGWNFQTMSNINKSADGRFHFVTKELADGNKIYILAFPGTERAKDIAVDMRVARVPFLGNTVAEFRRTATERNKYNHQVPLVHCGFNDYAMTAMFDKKLPDFGSLTAGEIIAQTLKKEPKMHLYLTGHSLGGAAAILTAARLTDLGINPAQLDVITFGSPAVGNEAFARKYENKINLQRITVKKDPVSTVLQSLSGGFVQFGQKEVWKQYASDEKIPHEMVIYLDSAIRKFQAEASGTSRLVTGTPVNIAGGIYLAPINFSLADNIADDKVPMKKMMHDILTLEYKPLVIEADDNTNSLVKWQQKAKAAGCKYIVAQDIAGKRIKTENNDYRMELTENIYDVQGNILNMQVMSTTTNKLTPLETIAYLHYQGKSNRQNQLR